MSIQVRPVRLAKPAHDLSKDASEPRSGNRTLKLRNDLGRNSDAERILNDAQRTSLARSVGAAIGDHVAIVAAAAAGYLAVAAALAASTVGMSLLALATNLVAVAISTRGMRGLENLVHEAAHYNFSRNKKLNDRIASWLVAAPLFQNLRLFRDGHGPHHKDLGGPEDPDLARNRRFHMDVLDRGSTWRYFRAQLRQLPQYAVQWFRAVGTDRRTLALGLAWHAVACCAIAGLLNASLLTVLGCWAAYWLVPFLVLLPVLRFTAEADEHTYAGATTIAEATVSNLGWFQRAMIHPHGDGYHTLHHLRPGIPHHRLPQAHHRLLSDAYEAYGRNLRVRTRTLQVPQRLQ